MTRDEFIRAGEGTGFQGFDSVLLAALTDADIAPRDEPSDDLELLVGDGDGDSVAPGADDELPDGGREPTPREE
jgi:hypothetical protein